MSIWLYNWPRLLVQSILKLLKLIGIGNEHIHIYIYVWCYKHILIVVVEWSMIMWLCAMPKSKKLLEKHLRRKIVFLRKTIRFGTLVRCAMSTRLVSFPFFLHRLLCFVRMQYQHSFFRFLLHMYLWPPWLFIQLFILIFHYRFIASMFFLYNKTFITFFLHIKILLNDLVIKYYYNRIYLGYMKRGNAEENSN